MKNAETSWRPKAEGLSRNAAARMRVEAVKWPALIPTGLCHSAQGCPQRTTLGQSSPKIFNPDGVVSIRQSHGVQPVQRSLQKSSLVVAAVCDRRDFEGILHPTGAHRAPLQSFCGGLFQGCDRFDIKPKVARCAQPWADGWNPAGIRAGGGVGMPRCGVPVAERERQATDPQFRSALALRAGTAQRAVPTGGLAVLVFGFILKDFFYA
jgi:hypothetical protein